MFTPCLGIIFQRVTDKQVTGHRLFQSFIQENKACFWNVHLVEAINSTKYVGYIKPSTLFITSISERNVQILRDAWTRRILRPAKGYRIETFGDVENIGMHKIDQIHSVPLLDIICSVVYKMNRSGRPAVMESLQNEIHKECPKIETPSPKTFRQAIRILLKQKILEYSLGELRICLPPTAPYHSLRNPSKCTVECQTGKSVINDCAPSNLLKIKKGFLARFSVKKTCLSNTVRPIQHPSNFPGQSKPRDLPVASTQSNTNNETSSAAQKAYLPHQDEFYRNWLKTNDHYLPINFYQPAGCKYVLYHDCEPANAPEYFPALTNYRSTNDKHRPKRRQRRKMDERGRTSTPVQRGSDSAFSLSPVITEISTGFCSSQSGDISPTKPAIAKRNHTYINILNNESTQFEDITQIERILPITLSITNV
uniref:Winged helix Storkhead-box1 domain-containing protein n=1 Tax=Setaria digitata TaxID=48799 RepID=A0A915Q2C9_9BILA